MIKVTESLNLASQKFKTNKARNIFSGCTVALGIILIIVVMIIIASISKLSKSAFYDFTEGRNIVSFSKYYSCNIFYGESEEDVEKCEAETNIEEFEKEYKKYDYDKLTVTYKSEFFNFAIDGLQDISRVNNEKDEVMNDLGSFDEAYSTITFGEEYLLRIYIDKDYSFEDKYDGKIPALISFDMVAGDKLSAAGSQDEIYSLKRETYKQYIGKSYKLIKTDLSTENPSEEFEDTDIEIIIVGFVNNGIEGFIVMPSWAKDKDVITNSIDNILMNNIYLEFDDQKNYEEFLKKEVYTFEANDKFYGYFSEVISRYEIYFQILKALRYVGYGIGGFLLSISTLFVFTTINKLVSDSTKEIAIYRAIGAHKNDIRKIILSYTFLLTNLGFLIGFVISLIIVMVLSLTIKDRTFYMIVNQGDNLNITKPLFIFLNFPVLNLTILYIFTTILGFISSIFPIWRATRIQPIVALRDE